MGVITEERLLSLEEEELNSILAYIENGSMYEQLIFEDKRYVLAHAGIRNYHPDKDLAEYMVEEFVEGRTDYSKRCFEDENTYLVTGHTPTFYTSGYPKFCCEVLKLNGHIAVDCGCVYGGQLAAYCFETEEVSYVKGYR